MTRRAALLLIWLAVPPFTSAQANIDTGCPVTQKIQPDGTMQFVDCKGRVTSQSLPVPAVITHQRVWIQGRIFGFVLSGAGADVILSGTVVGDVLVTAGRLRLP